MVAAEARDARRMPAHDSTLAQNDDDHDDSDDDHDGAAAAAELTAAEQAAGAIEVRRTIERLGPRLVALLGLTLYPVFFPRGGEPGPGLKRARLGGARLFVLPNPSGLNRAYAGFDAKLIWFRRLRRAAASTARDRAGAR